MGHYDDIESRRALPFAGLISLILLVIVFIAMITYLILQSGVEAVIEKPAEERPVETVYTTPTEDSHSYALGAIQAIYEENKKALSAVSEKVEHITDLEQQLEEKEEDIAILAKLIEEAEAAFSSLEEERNEYKRAYEELESYAKELIEIMKEM